VNKELSKKIAAFTARHYHMSQMDQHAMGRLFRGTVETCLERKWDWPTKRIPITTASNVTLPKDIILALDETLGKMNLSPHPD
jgi:hypothetical protein